MGELSAAREANPSFRQKLQNPEYRQKFIHSLVLFLGFTLMGLRAAQHPPAFLDLAQITGTNVEQASMFYTSMAVGGFVGTFCMGLLFDKLANHRLFLLSATCVLGAITTVAVPWSTNYFLTIFMFFWNTFFQVAFDTGANASMLSTWGVDGKMYMQFLHFTFSFGTIISPLTVQPFLSHPISGNVTHCQQPTSFQTDTQFHPHHLQNSTPAEIPNVADDRLSNDSLSSAGCVFSESRIHYAYLIAGVLCLFSGIVLAIEGCLVRTKPKQTTKVSEDHRNSRVLPTWLSVMTLTLTSAMIFFHLASIITIIAYIMAFCVEGLGWTKERVTMLSAVFGGGHAASRLMGVFISKFLSPCQILFFSNTIVVISLGGLWLSVVQSSDWGIWASIFFSAVGFAVILPTGIIYLETDVMKVTGKVTSVVIIAANIQGIANPPLIGYLMQEVSFMWYIYLALIQGTLCFVLYILLVIVVKVFVSKSDAVEISVEVDEAEEDFIPRNI